MSAHLENSAVATGLEKVVFIPIPKKGSAKEGSNRFVKVTWQNGHLFPKPHSEVQQVMRPAPHGASASFSHVDEKESRGQVDAANMKETKERKWKGAQTDWGPYREEKNKLRQTFCNRTPPGVIRGYVASTKQELEGSWSWNLKAEMEKVSKTTRR